MSELIKCRGLAKGAITRLKTYAEAITVETSLEAVMTRKERLEEAWTEFQRLDAQLAATDQASELVEIEEKYLDTKELLLRHINYCIKSEQLERDILSSPRVSGEGDVNATLNNFVQHQKTILSQHHQPGINLPSLSIAPFSGNLREWPAFKDSFQSAIHTNEKLSAIHKFQYLKGLVRAEAASVIKHFIMSSENYKEAWDKLCKRFDKEKAILSSYIQAFMDQPSVSSGSAIRLRQLADQSDEIIRGISSLSAEASNRDPWLIHIMINKLDSETKRLWAIETAKNNYPTVQELLEFLATRCDALESMQTCSTLERQSTDKRVETQGRRFGVQSLIANSTSSCPKCQQNHAIYKCPSYKSLSVDKRREFVKQTQICFNCLTPGHQASMCTSKFSCHYCNHKHHSTLHLHSTNSSLPLSNLHKNTLTPNQSNQQSNNNTTSTQLPSHISQLKTSSKFTDSFSAQQSTSNEIHSLPTHFRQTFALLPTAQVFAVDAAGKLQLCRILLDSASAWSFISEACVNRLQLKRTTSHANVSGIGAVPAAISKQTTTVRLISRLNHNYFIDLVDAHILPKVTSKLPSSQFSIGDWEYIQHLTLADPYVNVPQKIDILVGAEHFFKILNDERIHGQLDHPVAQSSIFGWIMAGPLPKTHQYSASIQSMTTSLDTFGTTEYTDPSIDQVLKKFWEMEEISHSKPHFSADEKACETEYQKHHYVSKENQHVVPLLFQHQRLGLGDSMQSAVSRMKSIEHRLKRSPELYRQYKEFMEEYLSLGHMEKIPENLITVPGKENYYLPHHPVIRESSTTTKVRVVFDGSCKTSSGESLNSQLMNGPTIQRNLQAILMSFRKHPIAFCADIEKMYRQVMVDSKHWDYQRILWRSTIEEPVSHFRLKTVTYGTKSAPFLAIRSLVETANEFEGQFPAACKIIKSDFYVDDLISGAESLQKGLELQQQLTTILSKRNFNLRKWASNAHQISKKFSTRNDGEPTSFDDQEITKVLGLQWCSNSDFFTFKVNDVTPKACTKRIILSESSKIFDPLGFLAPCTVAVKIIFQQLWLQNLDWDDSVPEKIASEWLQLRNHYNLFAELKLQRLIFPATVNIQIHGFSDASERAYSAVVYSRCSSADGRILVRLIAAKTKVAPLKQITIPKLELCGATLLTNLMHSIVTALEMPSVQQIAWTDSTTVLHWLASYPCRWKTYVANRVAEIVDLLPRNNWKYIPSEDNPADCASRGLTPEQLCRHSLWWQGPPWLAEPENQWPTLKSSTVDPHNVLLEEKKVKVCTFNTSTQTNELDELFERKSSLRNILRIIAFVRRIMGSNRSSLKSNFLTANEIHMALKVCLRWAQQASFAAELKAISHGQRISSKSTLLALSPIIDQEGILRVGGRLENANIPYETKHPAILPHQHILSKRIIEMYHQQYLHAGAGVLGNIVKQRFWIIRCRSLMKVIVKNCIKCFRHRVTRDSQLMAHLPEHRVTPGRAFLYTGIDYAGPIKIRESRLRKARVQKTYVAVFVCFATKAVHLELVDNLTSEAFISALSRFVSRRGIPAKLYSDNGTNFIGAKNLLAQLKINTFYDNQVISNFCSQQFINWNMIPPSAPHFGGLWEAAVKSMKYHLKRVVGETALTFSEMSTLLTQIEGILNSRPLIKMNTDDADDLDVLTPAHFLIGQPIIAMPEQILNDKTPIRTRWRLVMKMHQDFWKLWHQNYLHTLQERAKWRVVKANLRINDIVLMREDNQPPTCWPLGKVIEIHPGKDGLVRVVTVKTSNGLYKRPITKLSKLPINEAE